MVTLHCYIFSVYLPQLRIHYYIFFSKYYLHKQYVTRTVELKWRTDSECSWEEKIRKNKASLSLNPEAKYYICSPHEQETWLWWVWKLFCVLNIVFPHFPWASANILNFEVEVLEIVTRWHQYLKMCEVEMN